MKQEMTPAHPPPLLNQALEVLRLLSGWSQKRLAEASGIAVSALSAYETGRRSLRRQRFDELVALLGYTPEKAEDMIVLLRGFRPTEPGSAPVGLTPADVQEIEREAALIGRAAADAARSRLTQALQTSRAEHARRQAETAWNRLKTYPPGDWRLLVENEPAFQTWAFAERLCTESETAAAANARRSVELAELAVWVAELLPGEQPLGDLIQGYSWAHLGNALRVASQLPKADEAFAKAWQHWQAGKKANRPGWLKEGRLLDLEASLRRDQRRLPESLSLLERALALAATESETVRALIKQANTLVVMGRLHYALQALEKALRLVDVTREPRQMLGLVFNRAMILCRLGRYDEAAELVPDIRERAIALRNELDLIRVRWLEGRIARGFARTGEAIESFAQVRAGFLAQSLTYDAALTTLELAALHLEQDNTREVRALAREMTMIFRAQGVHKEAMAALRLFQEAAERETLTLDLTNRIVDYFERARHDPGLRFAA